MRIGFSMWHHVGGSWPSGNMREPHLVTCNPKGWLPSLPLHLPHPNSADFLLPNPEIFPLICEEIEALNPPFHLLSRNWRLETRIPSLARIPTFLNSEARIHEREDSDTSAQQAEPQQHAGRCYFAAEPRQRIGFRGKSEEGGPDLGGGGPWRVGEEF